MNPKINKGQLERLIKENLSKLAGNIAHSKTAAIAEVGHVQIQLFFTTRAYEKSDIVSTDILYTEVDPITKYDRRKIITHVVENMPLVTLQGNLEQWMEVSTSDANDEEFIELIVQDYDFNDSLEDYLQVQKPIGLPPEPHKPTFNGQDVSWMTLHGGWERSCPNCNDVEDSYDGSGTLNCSNCGCNMLPCTACELSCNTECPVEAMPIKVRFAVSRLNDLGAKEIDTTNPVHSLLIRNLEPKEAAMLRKIFGEGE